MTGIRPMAPRWEDAAFAAGRAVAIVSGTREQILAGGGEVRVVRDEAGLEPLRPVARLNRQDLAVAAKILARFPLRRAA